MFSSRNILLCLVALFTSIALSLPVTPSSSILPDLVDPETLTGTKTITLVDIPTDDNSLVSRQDSPDVVKKKQLEFCRENFGYCEDLCGDLNNMKFCDEVSCIENSSYCRKVYGHRCTPWGGSWWCNPKATPPALDEEVIHDKVTVDSAAIPPPPPPSAEVTVTATLTKEFMVPEQTPVSSVVKSATPSPTSTGGDEDDSMSKENTQSLVKRGGWYCLWLCD
ncbi:hypothetical protein KCU77_g5000, partial [Aureobasidium melanogenum]